MGFLGTAGEIEIIPFGHAAVTVGIIQSDPEEHGLSFTFCVDHLRYPA
jgi:hypothetical protein